ncbi:PP2C family serine/threonine-protein phosphatase [Uliginosibacterium sp. TH139]|uniref:PP2C family protein-serine/threonine phosphatase n=1 Tax=Uliginosibacterium sp. TH139 TaxID=2067453 RepID=UPI000C7D6054|nr:protein phosphatase 2C domain-containing protein [Uliginosibacterium sp. TH139]PLK49897.1 serine/threonine-protein phosphatase [Uliginosibacterium sp. TH139]
MLALYSAEQSHIGARRRNEDACGQVRVGECVCLCVSDGAGGHSGGDVAARIVVETVLDMFEASPGVSSAVAARLIEAAHGAVLVAKQDHVDDMHATCALLLIDLERREAVWAHAGDSRVYFFRAGEVVFQTRDHSLVQTMIDAGYGGLELTRTHPQRSLLTSAIGNLEGIEVSVSGEALPLHAGDCFLVCSDGWWEHVHETQMVTTLAEAASMPDWLERMARVVSADPAPRHDNYTAIAVRLQDAAGRSLHSLEP